MADFTAKDVQRLRMEAGVGMMDAKQALADTGGDFDAAFQQLREKGLAATAKRADREANEGTIGSYLHFQSERAVVGVLVELTSETDFVAKSPEFQEAARDLAMHVAWSRPDWIRREDVPASTIADESAIIAKQADHEGKPADVIPRIVEGRLNAFYRQHVLYEQPFVNKEKFDGTVGDLIQQLAARMGENIGVRRIARLAIGEG